MAALATLVACGGGGDVAGDTTEFFTNPSDWTLEVAADKSGYCSNAYGAEIFVSIIGGRPPFRIQNPSPKSIRVDRTEVTGKDPVFKVTSLGGCVSPASILILDYHSRSTIFKVTVTSTEEEPAVD